MQDLFASPTSTTLAIALLVVLIISLIVLGIGIPAYRQLVLSRWDFLSSLEHDGHHRRAKPVGVLAWIYVAVTVALAATTVYLALWQPSLT